MSESASGAHAYAIAQFGPTHIASRYLEMLGEARCIAGSSLRHQRLIMASVEAKLDREVSARRSAGDDAMDVLFVMNNLAVGGSETKVVRLANALGTRDMRRRHRLLERAHDSVEETSTVACRHSSYRERAGSRSRPMPALRQLIEQPPAQCRIRESVSGAICRHCHSLGAASSENHRPDEYDRNASGREMETRLLHARSQVSRLDRLWL